MQLIRSELQSKDKAFQFHHQKRHELSPSTSPLARPAGSWLLAVTATRRETRRQVKPEGTVKATPLFNRIQSDHHPFVCSANANWDSEAHGANEQVCRRAMVMFITSS